MEKLWKFFFEIIDDGSEDKKVKDIKKFVIKIKLKFENHKNCLDAAQLENKINYLEKNKINYLEKNKTDIVSFVTNTHLKSS